MTQSPKITDIPLSQLRPLHDLEQVSAEDVRRHIAPQYGEFAEQIAAVFNGSAVAHPELNAANLNPQPPAPEPQAAPQAPEPHADATLSFSGTSEIKDMSPQKKTHSRHSRHSLVTRTSTGQRSLPSSRPRRTYVPRSTRTITPTCRQMHSARLIRASSQRVG